MRFLSRDCQQSISSNQIQVKGNQSPHENVSYAGNDAPPTQPESTFPFNVVNERKYQGLIKNTSSAVSTLKHQSSVLTSLHPSAKHLYSRPNQD